MEPRATEHGRFVLSGTDDDDDDDDDQEGLVAGLMTPHPRFPPRFFFSSVRQRELDTSCSRPRSAARASHPVAAERWLRVQE